jgi:HPt (histidine-containing phosphotransfer) domain-containing protein
MAQATTPLPRLVGGLPPLPGIDVKAGMATSMNKESLYTRMLQKFRDSQGKFAEIFAATKADPDPEAATRAAHTLKGTAGNIGAKGVQAAAGKLEQACKEHRSPSEIDALLANVLAELAPVIAGLQQIGADTKPANGVATASAASASSIGALPPAEVNAVLDNLKVLLEDSDSEAGDVLADLLDKLEGSPLASSLRPVAAAIEGFDFDVALERLAASRQGM